MATDLINSSELDFNERWCVHDKLKNVGHPMSVDAYPAQPRETQERLWDALGKPYRNELWSESRRNEWSSDTIMHNKIPLRGVEGDRHLQEPSIPFIRRGFALNHKTGWIAVVSVFKLWVFEPVGSLEFKLFASLSFTADCPLSTIGLDTNLGRLRFVGDQLFVFSHCAANIVVYKVCKQDRTIRFQTVLDDPYFRESTTKDIVVTDDLLLILFDRWCGVYKLHPRLEWYHAIAFSKTSVQSYSIEMNTHQDEELEDENPLQYYTQPYFTDCSGAQLRLTKATQLVNNLRQEQQNGGCVRSSAEHYMVINTQDSLIGAHPTNPSFDLLHVANRAPDREVQFTTSKHYGVFYTAQGGRALFQSPHMSYDSARKIDIRFTGNYASSAGTPQLRRILNMEYDETYGVSGRLLLFVEHWDGRISVQQMINRADLVHFGKEMRVDFFSPYGVVLLNVYQMLFGNDLIRFLLCYASRSRSRSSRKCKEYARQN